jgi:hypothetical protein
MRVKHQAQKHKMTKGMNVAMRWVPSAFTQKELDKTRADGLISNDDKVIFPSAERVPKTRDGFQVMFFAYLLRGLIRPKRIYFPEHFCYCFSSNLYILNAIDAD